MSPRTLVVVQRLALLAAILASAALVIDYQNIGDPTFCGAESACYKVRASDVGRDLAGYIAKLSVGNLKMTVPHAGLLAHVVLLGLSLAASTRAWMRVVAGVAFAGALGALYLLIAQARMGVLCPWCAVVDVSSIVCATCSILLARAAGDLPEPVWGREGQTSTALVVWSAAASAMVGLPFVWASFGSTAPLPPPIVALQEPGKVTVVSFTDFECPFCRKLAPALKPMHDDPAVSFKRFMAPLDMHPGARPAALAYLCVDEALQNAFADALYEAPDGSFSAGNLAWMARRLGMKDDTAFKACMESEATTAKLDKEVALFKEAGGQGLPTTWVGRRMVKGFQPEKVQSALEVEKRGTSVSLPVWLMFIVAAAVGGWTAAMHLRAAAAFARIEARRRARSASQEDVSSDPAKGEPEGEATAKSEPDEAHARPKKARRKPATTVAETPLAKRARESSEPPHATETKSPEAKDAEARGAETKSKSDGVIGSPTPEGAPDPDEGGGEET